jgi:UDP-glucuronate decarboxylase
MRSGYCYSGLPEVSMSRKKILVTGGAGFLGSHLCEALIGRGHAVICLDNLHTGTRENLAPLFSSPHFQFVEHDICYPIDMEVEEIYNLACPASPLHYQESPIQTTQTSVLGALHVLNLARKRGAKVLQASTSEVYGDPKVHPQHESYWGDVNPIGRRACYDEGKRCAEALFFDYFRKFSLPIKIARIFNTYGPRMQIHDGRVVSNFIAQALQHLPLTIYGRGVQTRSFCYVSDLIAGLILLMESPKEFTGPVNLGNPSEFTILELAEVTIRLTQSRSKLHFQELPSDDPKQRRPDIALAQAKLGWTPHISLEEGLAKTINYFQQCVPFS